MPIFLGICEATKMQMSDGTKVRRMPNRTVRVPSNNQPVATDNTTGNEAGRAVSSMALTISHLQWREGREGEETDQMDLERMKNWFCQPNEPTAFLPSSLAPPCIGVSGCLTDCDGQCNGCPSILRRSERRATMFPRSALSVKIN